MNDQPDLFTAPAEDETAVETTPAVPPATIDAAPSEVPAASIDQAGADDVGVPPSLPPAAGGPADDIPPPADYAAAISNTR